MILEARRRHRRVVFGGLPLLLGLLTAAYFVRPGPVSTDLSPLEPTRVSSFRAVATRADLFGELPVEVQFSGAGVLRVSTEALLGPAVLLYFREGEVQGEGVDRARLLGSLPTRGPRDFRMPENWRGGGHLLLFSLGHMELLARSVELPTVPEAAGGEGP